MGHRTCSSPILRDAALRAAPQDEVTVKNLNAADHQAGAKMLPCVARRGAASPAAAAFGAA